MGYVCKVESGGSEKVSKSPKVTQREKDRNGIQTACLSDFGCCL